MRVIRRARNVDRRRKLPVAVLVLIVLSVAGFATAAALAKNNSVGTTKVVRFVNLASNTVQWTGQGSDSVKACGADQTPYLHWIFTTGGSGSTVSAATLTLGGSGSGDYAMSEHGGSWTVDTGYYDLGTLAAYVTYTGSLGSGNSNLVISDGCYGSSTTTTTPTTTTCSCTTTTTQTTTVGTTTTVPTTTTVQTTTTVPTTTTVGTTTTVPVTTTVTTPGTTTTLPSTTVTTPGGTTTVTNTTTGPTQTVTVTTPGPTQTVTVTTPGPTQTVTTPGKTKVIVKHKVVIKKKIVVHVRTKVVHAPKTQGYTR